MRRCTLLSTPRRQHCLPIYSTSYTPISRPARRPQARRCLTRRVYVAQSVETSEADAKKKNRKEGYDLIDIYGDPAKFLKAVTIRTEEEEDYLVSQYGFI